MEQIAKFPCRVIGAAIDDLVTSDELCIEALGEESESYNSSLTALAYLYRRFGPPLRGHDSYKEICRYVLTTADPEVWLSIAPKACGLSRSVSYYGAPSLREESMEPYRKRSAAIQSYWASLNPQGDKDSNSWSLEYYHWLGSSDFKDAVSSLNFPSIPSGHWREMGGVYARVNGALFDALRELLRPVYVRDVPINVFGFVSDSDPSYLLENARPFFVE